MAFFDDVSKRWNDMVQSVQKTADSAKVQRQISQKQAEFDDIYRQIGQMYYNSRVNNTPPDASIDTLCDTLTAMSKEIEDLRQKADEIQNVRRCAECGQVVDKTSKFCNHCGARLPEDAPEPAPADEADDADEGFAVDWPEVAEEAAEAVEYVEEAAEVVEEAVEAVEEADEAIEEASEDVADTVEEYVETVEEEYIPESEDTNE